MKRQKEKIVEKAELVRVTPSGTDNKLYTDVCSYQTKSWCPNGEGTECPPACRTVNITGKNDIAPVNAASPTSVIKVPQVLSEGNAPSVVVQPQEKAQRAFATNLAQEELRLPQVKDDEAGLISVDNSPLPQVRIYTDICLKSTEFPWCPQSVGYVTCYKKSFI